MRNMQRTTRTDIGRKDKASWMEQGIQAVCQTKRMQDGIVREIQTQSSKSRSMVVGETQRTVCAGTCSRDKMEWTELLAVKKELKQSRRILFASEIDDWMNSNLSIQYDELMLSVLQCVKQKALGQWATTSVRTWSDRRNAQGSNCRIEVKMLPPDAASFSLLTNVLESGMKKDDILDMLPMNLASQRLTQNVSDNQPARLMKEAKLCLAMRALGLGKSKTLVRWLDDSNRLVESKTRTATLPPDLAACKLLLGLVGPKKLRAAQCQAVRAALEEAPLPDEREDLAKRLPTLLAPGHKKELARAIVRQLAKRALGLWISETLVGWTDAKGQPSKKEFRTRVLARSHAACEFLMHDDNGPRLSPETLMQLATQEAAPADRDCPIGMQCGQVALRSSGARQVSLNRRPKGCQKRLRMKKTSLQEAELYAIDLYDDPSKWLDMLCESLQREFLRVQLMPLLGPATQDVDWFDAEGLLIGQEHVLWMMPPNLQTAKMFLRRSNMRSLRGRVINNCTACFYLPNL